MKYVPLKKIFHINENECNELYKKRFWGDATNKLGITLKNGYECFYVINDEILLEDVINEEEKDKPDGVIFRNGPVEVKSSVKTIYKGINGEINIIDMLDKSLIIPNNEDIHFLIKIAVFHYLFEYIHPFYNGNGRMGRFLASSYLSNYLNILCALQFSIACINNNKKYYDSFTLTNDIRNKADLTVFIINFLEIYLSGLEESKEQIESTINTYHYMMKKICNHIDSKYKSFVDLILQVTLFDVDGFYNAPNS